MPAQTQTKNAIEQIYDQLMQVFGGTNPNQFLTLLMPATTLDQANYAYDVTGTKPELVAAAESLLVDQMFDIAKVTGSSNGERFSAQYMQALSVLVPIRRLHAARREASQPTRVETRGPLARTRGRSECLPPHNPELN